ncbi:MAG: response regulator [Thermodesulfobacteriota bacterium]
MSTDTPKKILVVDDELDTRIFLLNLLNASGFLPVAAENNREGYRIAAMEKPSVIILNMTMAGKGGIQLYRELKREDDLKNIPVIMLSTLDKATFMKCHILYGVPLCEEFELIDKFMEKPPEADDLIAMVQDLSGRTRVGHK